jgi:hypothetical protein
MRTHTNVHAGWMVQDTLFGPMMSLIKSINQATAKVK